MSEHRALQLRLCVLFKGRVVVLLFLKLTYVPCVDVFRPTPSPPLTFLLLIIGAVEVYCLVWEEGLAELLLLLNSSSKSWSWHYFNNPFHRVLGTRLEFFCLCGAPSDLVSVIAYTPQVALSKVFCSCVLFSISIMFPSGKGCQNASASKHSPHFPLC